MDAAERVAGFDRSAGLAEMVDADGWVDGVVGAGAAGTEGEDGLADGGGVGAGEDAGAWGGEVGDDRGDVERAADAEEVGVLVRALGGDHGLEAIPDRAVAETGGVGFARGGGEVGGEVEDEGFEVSWAETVHEFDAFADLEGIACGGAEGFVHG